jgi:hypothetical protein
MSQAAQTHVRDTQWLADIGWGVFTHYLTDAKTTADDWNRQVDAFDVDALAARLAEVGAGYYFFTVGQNSGHWCAPNAAYDAVMEWGPSGSLCSRRDLILDLAAALAKRKIRLMVYHTCDAALAHPEAVRRFRYTWGFKGEWPHAWGTERTGLRQAEFQLMWEAVTREWALRWGRKVIGWWMDGCYFADEMYRHPDAPNFESLCAALRAGNPDALVAFNPGVLVPVICHTPLEDFTAGEIAEAFPVCPGPFVKQARYHILSYLGKFWCQGEPRFPDEFVVGYTKHVMSKGGVVTWDVPIDRAGAIPEAFGCQLRQLPGHGMDGESAPAVKHS